MCILLKLHYTKFDVSGLFLFKRYQRKTFGGSARPPPPLVKEGLKGRQTLFITDGCSAEGEINKKRDALSELALAGDIETILYGSQHKNTTVYPKI